MLKNWKGLFVKSDEEPAEEKKQTSEPLSFPVNPIASTNSFNNGFSPQAVNDPTLKEILSVYENGLDSINMPGYDFYEFYQAIASTGNNSEQAYKMAFQMARTLDKSISTQKFHQDADFYISKINEVHGEYSRQGQQKLNALQSQKTQEKAQLNNDIDQATKRINDLKAELMRIENDINLKRNTLARIDEGSQPQEKLIKEKLTANDQAHQVSIDKLNAVKQGIQQFLKD
jgi:hypothetical protein